MSDHRSVERGTWTVVFTDLVASTEVRVGIGDDRFDHLRRRHDAMLERVVDEHGGLVVKFGGDGMMALFASAATAVDACVRCQIFAGPLLSAHPKLRMRVGAATGDVVRDGGDAHGTPVVEAARLCSIASGGQILCTPVVVAVAGSRLAHRISSLGEQTLKGLAAPVEVIEVLWSPASTASSTLPPALDAIGSATFVGRAAELDSVRAAWGRRDEHRPVLAFVAGEPGIGKTRLLREFALDLADEAVVLAGRCERDSLAPFQPFVEALRSWIRTAPVNVVTQCIDGLVGLDALLPELEPSVVSAGRTDDRMRTFDAVAIVLSRIGNEHRLLLVLDDLHWASDTTTLLLRHLAHAPELSGSMILGAYRDTDLARHHPFAALLADLRRDGVASRTALDGLDESAVQALVCSATVAPLDERGVAIARAVHLETDGNPFFVNEMATYLVESGAFAASQPTSVDGDSLIRSIGLPDGVREVVGRRLSALSRSTGQILQVAATIGREVDVALLADVADAGEPEILDAIDAAVSAGLLAEVTGSDRVSFAHAIIRDVLLAEMTSARRRRLHARIANALEQRAGADHRAAPDRVVPDLAMHWREAGAVGPAVHYLRRAAQLCIEGVAYEEAVQRCHEALELLAESDDVDEEVARQRADLLLIAGRAQNKAGGFMDAKDGLWQAAELARTVGDARLLTQIALAYGGSWGFVLDGEDLRQHVLLTDALTTATDGSDRAMLLASLASLRHPRLENAERLALTERALAEMNRGITSFAEAHTCFRVLHAYELVDDNVGLGHGLPDRLIECSRDLHDREWTLIGHEVRARLAWVRGAVEAAEPDFDVRDALAAELRLPYYLWSVAMRRSDQAIMSGRFDDAERELIPASAAAARVFLGEIMETGIVADTTWAMRVVQGRFEEFAGVAAYFVGLLDDAYEPALWYRLRLAVDVGDIAGIGELLPRAIPTREAVVLPYMSLPALDAYRLRAAEQLGDTKMAEHLSVSFRPHPDAPTATNELGSFGVNGHWYGRALSLVGDFDRAIDALRSAVAVYERRQLVPWVAFGRWDLASALQRRDARGDAAEAATMAASARAVADSVGVRAPLR